MSEYLLQLYLPALASTLAIEVGVAVLLGVRSPRQLGAVLLVNLVSHPTLHVVLWVSGWREPAPLIGLEAAVFVVESLLLVRLLRLTAPRAMLLSAAMNLTSAILGLALPF